MKILFSNSIASDKWGGGEKWIILAAQGLKERGHQVVIGGRRGSVFLENARQNSLPTRGFNICWDYSVINIFRISNYLKRENFDCVILNMNKDVRVVGLAARKARLPVIIARHGAQLIYQRWKYRLTMSIVDGIITNNYSLKRIYENFSWMPKDKVQVIYNGIEVPEGLKPLALREVHKIRHDHFLVLAAGRLSYEKGFDILIKAVSLGKAESKPFSVLVAGSGELERALKKQAKKLKVETIIKFVGFMDEMLPFYAAADLVVLPSRYEGMPNAVMEAMAVGKPVVATRVNGVEELIEHKKEGWIVSPESPQDLWEGIRYAMLHPQESEVWGKNAQLRIEHHFSLNQMIKNLENYLQERYSKADRGMNQ